MCRMSNPAAPDPARAPSFAGRCAATALTPLPVESCPGRQPTAPRECATLGFAVLAAGAIMRGGGTLLRHDGRVYVAGSFRVAGLRRNGLVALNPRSGRPDTRW